MQNAVQYTTVVQGSVADFDEANYTANLANMTGVDAANISLEVSAGSVKVVATVNVVSAIVASTIAAKLLLLTPVEVATQLQVALESIQPPVLLENVVLPPRLPSPPAAPPSPAQPPSPVPSSPPPVPDTCFTLEVETDAYPEETSWNVTAVGNTTLLFGRVPGYYTELNKLTYEEFCLPEGEYVFLINDDYGDGMAYQQPFGAPRAALCLGLGLACHMSIAA